MLIGGFHGLILLSLQTIMANDFFKFRQFTISQQRCAMKVGTDGTLLGAWARTSCQGDSEKSRILDIGTGTGLIALMMAQRYPNAVIKAIDIDENAVCQARENVSVSPFSTRIEVIQADIALFESDESFDAIVCNPPYFTAANSMESPDFQRRIARQTHSLDFKMLVNSVKRLLAPKGLFSVVIPTDGYGLMANEAMLADLYVSRLCRVRTTPRKVPKRVLIEFSKLPVDEVDITDGVIEIQPNIRSSWYQELTQDFYII